MRQSGLEPDVWQTKICESTVRQQLLLAHRQFGKSTCYAAIAAETACNKANALVLLVSRTQRQAAELFRKVAHFYHVAQPMPLLRESALSLEAQNHSRIISLPAMEDTVLGYSAPDLIVLDEAARVHDGLYMALRPMLGMGRGRIIMASTPWGSRGFFWSAWEGETHNEEMLDAAQVQALLADVGITVAPEFARQMAEAPAPEWERTKITAPENPRITPQFLAQELRSVPRLIFESEYLCKFVTPSDSVFNYNDLQGMMSDAVRPLWQDGPQTSYEWVSEGVSQLFRTEE